MDVVLALSLEWNDTRLVWGANDFGYPVYAIQVNSEDIWTPNVDLANRIHNYSPNTERYLKTTVGNDCKGINAASLNVTIPWFINDTLVYKRIKEK